MSGLASAVVSVPSGTDIHEALQPYSDGLPLVPPTRGRVLKMLQGTSRAPEEELRGQCPPNLADVTVEKVAIAAVMAGCEPRQFTVVLAATEAILADDFNLHGTHATTMGATPCVIVSGPVRAGGGYNTKHGALGSGSRANAATCRALKLVLQNVGGARLAGTESTTLGTPMKFTLTVAEWEERLLQQDPKAEPTAGEANDASSSSSAPSSLPTWEAYHETRGFRRDESIVTVLALTSGPHQLVDFSTRSADLVVKSLADVMAPMYSTAIPLINECLVVLSPEHYDTLRRGGIASKAELARRLWAATNAGMAPAVRSIVRNNFGRLFAPPRPDGSSGIGLKHRLLAAVVLGGTVRVVGWILTYRLRHVIARFLSGNNSQGLLSGRLQRLVALVAAVLPLTTPPQLWLPALSAVIGTIAGAAAKVAAALGRPLGFLPKFSSPESFHILVAGAPAGKFSACAPGFGVGRPPMATAHLNRPVSRTVEPIPVAVLRDSQAAAAAAGHPAAAAHDDVEDGSYLFPGPGRGATSAFSSSSALVAPRPGDGALAKTLDGKVIAMLDISKAQGNHLLDRIQQRLAQDFPAARVVRFTKPTFSRPAPAALRDQILSGGRPDFLVAALAD